MEVVTTFFVVSIYIDPNIVWAGVVGHPSEWAFELREQTSEYVAHSGVENSKIEEKTPSFGIDTLWNSYVGVALGTQGGY